jgi:uncharacterized membrane protein
MHVIKAITVLRPLEEVYRFWVDFQNMPRFMSHLDSVESTDGGRSRWRSRSDEGESMEWESEVIEQVPNEMIAWQSTLGSDVKNRGAAYFSEAPGDRGTEVRVELTFDQPGGKLGDRGTEVRVELTFDQPGGKLGSLFSKLFGEDPGTQVSRDLRRFKQILETGEVVHSDASIHKGMHPARPAEAGELAGTAQEEARQ